MKRQKEKWLYGYKVVREKSSKEKIDFVSATPLWGGACHTYSSGGIVTVRKDPNSFGPLAVFTTLESAKYFFEKQNKRGSRMHLFSCLYARSKERKCSILGFTVGYTTGDEDVDYADEVKLLEEVEGTYRTQRTRNSEEKIKSLIPYWEQGFSAERIAKQLNMSASSVRLCQKKYETQIGKPVKVIPLIRRGLPSFSKETLHSVISFLKKGVNCLEISRRLKLPYSGIRKVKTLWLAGKYKEEK